MQKIIIIMAVLLALPQPAVAQASSALTQGVRLEITPVNAKPQVGTLISLTNDSLLIDVKRAQPVSMALTRIKSVKVSRGRSHFRGAVTKGLLGAGLGILTGGAIAGGTWSEESMDFFCGGSRGACVAFGSMMGGSFGLVAGTIYGAIRGDERWESVSLPTR